MRTVVGRGRFATFALVVACAAALVSIVDAPRSVFPSIALARVEIFADAGDLPAEAVRTTVAQPLERALATVPGVRTTRTYAVQGKLELELDFDGRRSSADDLRAVRDVLASMREALPISNLTSVIEGPEEEPVVTYAIRSRSLDQARLERRVRAALVTTFLGTRDLGRLTVFAGPRVSWDVALDAQRLAAHRLDVRDVARAISDANRTRAVGTLVHGDERQTLLSNVAFDDRDAGATHDALAVLSVSNGRGGTGVPLRELARIDEARASTGTQASFDAEHAVVLNAYATPEGNAVALARDVAACLIRLRAALPADARIDLAWDQTRLILASQRALVIEMLLGAALALVAIAAFLRDRALVVAAAVVLPLALAWTAAALVRFGLHFDLMTLGGLAIAIGLIVDEAIVVVEAIARESHDAPALAPRAASRGAVRRVARPLIAATAANVVVFVPLALLGGVPGSFFRALATTLAVALVVSIALSLVLAPRLAAALRVRARRAPRALRIERAYVRMLRLLAPRGTLVLVGIAGLAASAIWVLAHAPANFLPNIAEGQFEIKFALPPGMSAEAADAVATRFERAVLLDPAVAHVVRLSGVDTNGYLATPPDAGTLRVTLKPEFARDPFDPIADRMRDRVGNVDPYAAIEVHQLLEDQINDLTGVPEPIVLTVRGPSQERLIKIAGALADDVAHVRGTVDTFDGVTWQARLRRVSPLAPAARADDAFASDVLARTSGLDAGSVASPSGSIPIVVRISDRAPLERRVRLGAPELASDVQEEDGERVVRVTADLEHADLSTTVATIQSAISPIVAALPPGYRVDVGGAIVAQHTAFVEFASIFALALVLVFGVLLAAFDSFRLPFAILAAVPLAPLGVALALFVTKTNLDIASFMGMLLLVGIVVRNGILLVDAAQRRVREGASPREAIERAAIERLRPIVMTTLAALGALAPLAAGIGAGAEMERPLAVAVIGGIVVATTLTLVVVPLLYLALVGTPRIARDGGTRALGSDR